MNQDRIHLGDLMAASVQPPAAPTDELQATNLYARLKDKGIKLTPEQVESCLATYSDRCVSFGEAAADSWLLSKYGQK